MNDAGQGHNQGCWTKWANHHVRFRDDGEANDHDIHGTWTRIVSPVRQAMADLAQ